MARACDHAGCTRAQADALCLLLLGYSIREISGELGLSYRQARACLDNGRERLETAYQGAIRCSLTWYRALLECIRNHRDCRPAPVLTYAPMYGGGYDQTPITVRARPHGAVADDLLESNRDFLRFLVDWLT